MSVIPGYRKTTVTEANAIDSIEVAGFVIEAISLIGAFKDAIDLFNPFLALREFGRDRGVNPSRWKLLTGNPSAVVRAARELYFADDDGMRVALGDADTFLHTEKVLLVDAGGHIRGIYNATQPLEIQKLIEDLNTLK